MTRVLANLATFTGGQRQQLGDGPLAQFAAPLLENYRRTQAARMDEAYRRADMAGKGPIFEVMQRKVAEARAAALFNDSTAMIMRVDAFQAMAAARARLPQDSGVRRCTAHVEHLWYQDSGGTLSIGDVARLRAHYASQYPQSKVAEVIDTELPKVGFNTLPVEKLAPLASQIVGDTDAERQAAFVSVAQAYGLTSNRPEHVRARAYLCQLADIAHEERQASAYDATGAGALDRALARMASYRDPILAQMGAGDPPPPMATDPMMDASMGDAPASGVPSFEDDVPHEETSEVIEQVDSPVTGEPLSLELGRASPEAPDMAGGPTDPALLAGDPVGSVAPGQVMAMAYFGQVEQYAADPLGPPAPAPMVDASMPDMGAGPQETTVIIEDPSAPGTELQVTLSPVEETNDMGATPSSAPMPMGAEAQRHATSMGAPARPIFAVFAVNAGAVDAQPLERVAAPTMPAMLRHVAMSLAESGGSYAVHAHPTEFAREAFVVLDDPAGNYLVVRAEHKMPGRMQVPTKLAPMQGKDRVSVPNDGATLLTQTKPMKKTKAQRKALEGLSSPKAATLLKERGLTKKKIEAQVLEGQEVRLGKYAVMLNADGDVVLFRGARGRTASLVHLDRVIGDFMLLAATEVASGAAQDDAPVAAARTASFQVRALFSVGCGHCGMVGEYLMPDRPEHVRCANCNTTTPPAAIMLQLEARQAQAFPGYVLTAGIPGDQANQDLNARRMLSAIREVVTPQAVQVRNGQLEIELRGVGDAELNRIRRVFADKFGVREVQAQSVPATPAGAPPVGVPPLGTQPAPGMPGQPPMQPAQTGSGVQQQQMQQYADPMAGTGLPSTRAAGLECDRLVLIQHPEGHQQWIPVEASTDHAARMSIQAYFTDAQILDVRLAQALPPDLGGVPEAGALDGDMLDGAGLDGGPAGGAAPSLLLPMNANPSGERGQPENIETARLDPHAEETIKAAMLHYRNMGVGIAEAVDSFVGNYRKFLDSYGDKTSPARHNVEAALIRISKEVYEKPALITAGAAGTRAAAGMTPPKPTAQHGPYVNLPGMGQLLGTDSSVGEGFSTPPPSKGHHKQPGISATSADLGPDSSGRDVSFGAKKPPKDGHVPFDGPGWGQSWADPDLGPDSQTGDNPTTKSWNGISSGAGK